MWGAVLVIVIAALAAGGNAGASWWKLLREDGKPMLEAATPPAVTAPVASARSASWAAESVRMVSLAPSTPVRAPIGPVLAEGSTTLREGIEAVRRGDTVVVSFDNPQGRTRRADKFDQLVRETLPRIYGPLADSLLALHPGRLVNDPRALVRELPTKGLSLAGAGEWRIVVWPETRPGQDGPLVIRYRTTLAR